MNHGCLTMLLLTNSVYGRLALATSKEPIGAIQPSLFFSLSVIFCALTVI